MVCGECGGSRACDVCDGYGDSTCGVECAACGGSGACPGCFGEGETSDRESLTGQEATR